jgi:anti-sigma factor RsiW
VTKADEGVTPSSRGAAHPTGTGVADLTHDLVRGQLSDYLDNSIDPADRRRVDGHLARCQSCTAYLHTLRATVRTLGNLPAPKAPSGVRARIIEQAHDEHGRTSAG